MVKSMIVAIRYCFLFLFNFISDVFIKSIKYIRMNKKKAAYGSYKICLIKQNKNKKYRKANW